MAAWNSHTGRNGTDDNSWATITEHDNYAMDYTNR